MVQEGKGERRLGPEGRCWKELDIKKLTAIVFTVLPGTPKASAEYDGDFVLAIDVDNAHHSLRGLNDPVGWAFVSIVAKMKDVASFGWAGWLEISAGARSPGLDSMEWESFVLHVAARKAEQVPAKAVVTPVRCLSIGLFALMAGWNRRWRAFMRVDCREIRFPESFGMNEFGNVVESGRLGVRVLRRWHDLFPRRGSHKIREVVVVIAIVIIASIVFDFIAFIALNFL